MSFLIAAPSSGSGKTTITLGLLRAFSRNGISVRGAKSGPDYIDPQFHTAACGKNCFNFDAWAMPKAQIRTLYESASTWIVEGAMGLFDGAPPDGAGSTADLARVLDLPIVLVIDCASMSQSIAPLYQGFANYDPSIQLAGVILNKVGSPRHDRLLRHALDRIGVRVFGAIHRDASIKRPSRHLGLVQAGEMPDLNDFIERAADLVEAQIDIKALSELGPKMRGAPLPKAPKATRTIAVAQDTAFNFVYAHHLAEWAASGNTIKTFSPLSDEPVPEADEVFLPGGYPELYAAQLTSNAMFLGSLREHAKTTPIGGECGGYMVLGDVLTDADGNDHQMAGLLPLHTSFAKRKLHLGYRNLMDRQTGQRHKGHEFHYATTVRSEGTPLFDVKDAEGQDLGAMGLFEGNVSGSFAHVISSTPPPAKK